MIDQLRAIAIFAETANKGSFRAAAKSLDLSPSVVSYHVTQLENKLGAALLYRSTRSLSLTHQGQVLYDRAKDMMDIANIAFSEISEENQQLTGKLSLSLPTALVRHPISKTISEFAKLHPKLKLVIDYTDQRQDLIAQGIDLAIRAGNMPDSTLKSKKLGHIVRKLVCSTPLYQQRETPAKPEDLQDWPWIHLAPMPGYRELLDPEGNKYRLHYQSRFEVNSVEALSQQCINGLGLATPPAHLIDQELARGNVIEVLPEWQVPPIPLYAVWPGNVTEHSNTKQFLNYLSESEN